MKKNPFLKQIALASSYDRLYFESGDLKDHVYFTDRDPKSTGTFTNFFPLISLYVSKRGHADLERFLGEIKRIRTIPDVPMVRLEPEGVDQAAALIRQVLDGGLGRLAAYTTSITRELAMLRREREALLENYRALEDAFRARNWDGTAEVFAHDPFDDPKDEGIGQILLETGVEQLLPVSSLGVSGIALHFRAAGEQGGDLRVELDYLESGEPVAEWSVPFEAILARWNFFGLPKTCCGSPRTLRLRVSATGGNPPAPSLGHPVSNLRYAARARVAHADLAHRPLAFRVFTGLPGVRPTDMTNVIAPLASTPERRVIDYRPPTEVLGAVTDISVTPVVPDFPTVYFVEHEAAIVCHPLTEGMTAGALGRVVAPDTVRVSVRVVVDHPEGAPAAVGLLLVASSADLRAVIAKLGAGGTPSQPNFFSGWREVTPQSPVNINLLLDAPLAVPMDLVVVSRAITASVDFCWLKFIDFRFVRELGAAA